MCSSAIFHDEGGPDFKAQQVQSRTFCAEPFVGMMKKKKSSRKFRYSRAQQQMSASPRRAPSPSPPMIHYKEQVREQLVQPNQTTIPTIGSTEISLQQSYSTSASTSDRLLQLCLLQRADGSFSLSDRLASAVGLTSSALQSLAAATHGTDSKVLDPVVFATLLAIAAMRSLFASQKAVWELQEGKALNFLASRGVAQPNSDSLIANLERSLKK
jgi:hypothetical protein